MRTLILFLFLNTLNANAQNLLSKHKTDSLDNILNSPIEIGAYTIDNDPSLSHIEIEFEFASAQFSDPEIFEDLDLNHILYLTYIYSDYSTSKTFNQSKLNRQRLYAFSQKCPPIKRQKINWEIIVQTAAKDIDEAIEMFHGIIIHYRKTDSKTLKTEEIESLQESIKEADFILPKEEAAYTEPSKSTSSMSQDEYYWYIKKRNAAKKRKDNPPKIDTSYSRIFSDTTVTEVFNRNKEWNKMLVICDLTASMSPYIAQLFVWYKLNIEKNKINNFVFLMMETPQQITKKPSAILEDSITPRQIP